MENSYGTRSNGAQGDRRIHIFKDIITSARRTRIHAGKRRGGFSKKNLFRKKRLMNSEQLTSHLPETYSAGIGTLG